MIIGAIGLFLLGCIGGFLFGMVGIGGNVLYIPIFSFILVRWGFYNEELSRAIIANALFILVFTGIAVSWKQFRSGNFFLREILLTASTGVLAAVILTGCIQNGHWYDKGKFDIVFTMMLSITLWRLFTSKKHTLSKPPFQTSVKAYPFLLVGAFTGSMTAFSGLGGSIVMIPLFTEIVGLEMKKAHSISVGVVPIMALSISIFYSIGQPHVHLLPEGQMGYINLLMTTPVILGSILTSPWGVRAAHQVKPQTQRLVFAVIVSIVLSKMILNLIGII